MSKHPIPDWLRSQFSRIEDEVQKLGPCGVFTQMRTVTQTYFEQQAEAPQPPALGGEPDVRKSFDDWFKKDLGLDERVNTTFIGGAREPWRAWEACSNVYLAPLQAEIASERELRRELGVRVHQLKDELKDIAQLKARNAELESALKFYADREHYHFESGNWDTVSGEPLNILWCGDEPDFIEDGSVARNALSKPAGSGA